MKDEDERWTIPPTNQEVTLEGEELVVYEMALEHLGWAPEDKFLERMSKKGWTKELGIKVLGELIEKGCVVRKVINGDRKWYMVTMEGYHIVSEEDSQPMFR